MVGGGTHLFKEGGGCKGGGVKCGVNGGGGRVEGGGVFVIAHRDLLVQRTFTSGEPFGVLRCGKGQSAPRTFIARRIDRRLTAIVPCKTRVPMRLVL